MLLIYGDLWALCVQGEILKQLKNLTPTESTQNDYRKNNESKTLKSVQVTHRKRNTQAKSKIVAGDMAQQVRVLVVQA